VVLGSGRGVDQLTARGRKRSREAWREALLDELSDETEDERRDFTNQSRNPFESEHGPVIGSDGDDNPAYTQPKAKFDGDRLKRGDISDPIQARPTSNPAGEIADAGHGFIINDPRSRPWKTAPRTHCAYCGDEMPKPDVSKYKCEFDPDSSAAELALIGEGQPRDAADSRWDAVQYMLNTGSPCRHGMGCRCGLRGCKCSGCSLRWLVASGMERNRGQPKKYCTPECRRRADAERNGWRRAVVAAEKRGDDRPPEPEDRGLKLVIHHGPRSSVEGNGHRYIASDGLPWGIPRA
jgi:hypothetical protein